MSGYAVGHVLRNSKQSGTSLIVLLVIAEAAHQDGTGAWPSVESIAQYARTTERHVRRLLPTLEKSGELLIEKGRGPHGTHVYTIVGVPEPRTRTDAHVRADILSGGTSDAPRGDISSTRGDTAMSPEPSLEPSLEPKEVLRARAREEREAPPARALSPAAEVKATLKDAKALWLAERRRHGHTRFTDAQALKGLASRIDAALAAHEVWQDIEAALKARAPDEKANPWYANEWVAAARDERELAEHLLRKSQGYDHKAPPHECTLEGKTTCKFCGLAPHEHGGGGHYSRREDAPRHIGGAVSAFAAGLQP